MASRVLDGLDKAAGGRGTYNERNYYEYDDYGNLSKKPLNYSKAFRNGGGDYVGYSSGYGTDRSGRQYYENHQSPYGRGGRQGGAQYSDNMPAARPQTKVEIHDWNNKSAKGKESEKNAGAKHHMSDVSDMEGNVGSDMEIFSIRQAAGEYGQVIQDEARYGLMTAPVQSGEWTPHRASGLNQELVMNWNGSCAQFAEKTVTARKGGASYDPTVFHYNKNLARNDLHAGRQFQIATLHPFEQNMVALNSEKGTIQPLFIEIYDYQNPLSFPVGVKWDGFDLANQQRFGNVEEKYMMILQPGGRLNKSVFIDVRPFLNAEDMQMAASVRSTHIRGDIMATPGSDRVAVNKKSLLFDCIVGYSGKGLVDIDWAATGEFPQNGEIYISNLPAQAVEFCVQEIEKKIRRKSSNISLNNLHWSLHALNPGGNFADYYQTDLEWMSKHNKPLLSEKIHSPSTVSLSTRIHYL